eukprot:scaffold19011_cov32-Tisochrysis_lutea.AAC.1
MRALSDKVVLGAVNVDCCEPSAAAMSISHRLENYPPPPPSYMHIFSVRHLQPTYIYGGQWEPRAPLSPYSVADPPHGALSIHRTKPRLPVGACRGATLPHSTLSAQ